ncbi:Oxysterol-binding protein-related protein 8 [Sarcoptes scabiei]|uniref:Oxysterol-binding protein n=1 Tax=Sarcoptes scabiei TaxID=52283 RepID=A0A834RC99_SARSC|nr:Oxysterol-binding protein-related protein 8 [Sarcoptes scabiei]
MTSSSMNNPLTPKAPQQSPQPQQQLQQQQSIVSSSSMINGHGSVGHQSAFFSGNETSFDSDSQPRTNENSLSTDPTALNNQQSSSNKLPVQSSTSSSSSYKDRRKNYRLEKKKLTDELISAIQDPTTVVMSDWLKVRTALKQWNKYYCELRPGYLYLYKNQKTYKSSNWIGTVMLKMCELLERPSKKNGFCFKLFHPLEHPIWSPKGPHGEEYTSFMFPLPICHVIFRAPSVEAGHKWMEAIELSLKCSDIMVHKPIQNRRDSIPDQAVISLNNNENHNRNSSIMANMNLTNSLDRSDDEFQSQIINEFDIEKHFDLDDDGHTDHGEHDDSQGQHTTEESDDSIFEEQFRLELINEEANNGDNQNDPHSTLKRSSSRSSSSKKLNQSDIQVKETNYVFDGGHEEFGLVGNAGQTEDVPEENKSLLWTLLKQVRPGMDLSKVVLPTFILEPRSFLEKLADYYYHCDIISKAALEDDPLMRMKLILKWYLSGFYKKPKGLKKPYNPILGETFRCCWYLPETDSRTFFIAEQVSHHPPISAFYVTNRKNGYCVSGSILAKSKFYGNSISAILEGTARLTLLNRGEDYLITFPYAHCKGIFWGPLAFELGGKVTITCEKTGYKSELEFKLKPFFGSEDQCNQLIGKVRLANETMANIEGHWDSEIFYKDKRKGEVELFWSGIDEKIKNSRLKRSIVSLSEQFPNESEKLWHKVTLAIQKQDQVSATEEKTILEEAQRDAARQRSSRMELWEPKFFCLDPEINDWKYKMAEVRPWDNRTDVKQYEHDYVIQTLTRHHNSTLDAMQSKNGAQNLLKNQPNSLPAPSQSNNTSVQKRKFRRQNTCPDPSSTSYGSSSGTSLSNNIFGKNLNRTMENIQQKLETLQESIDQIRMDQNSLQKKFDYFRSDLGDLNRSMSRSHKDFRIKTFSLPSSQSQSPSSSSSSSSILSVSNMFAITRIQLRLLFETIPIEIRLVLIVLLAHLLFHYLYCYFS